MAGKNKLFKALRDGETLLGLSNMYPAAGIIEGMCAGWDFVWIDCQHGQLAYDSALQALMSAKATGIHSVLRVPSHEHGMLGVWADLDPDAIMVPMVNRAQQALDIVAGLRFPPLGKRSFGGRRVIDLHGRDFYKERELMVVAQIETPEAVENAEAIINTEGIDLLFFSPDDMKLQMGLDLSTSVTENQQLSSALEHTVNVAEKAGKLAGTVAANPDFAQSCVDIGYQLIVAGADIMFIRNGASKSLSEMNKALGK